MKKEHKGTLRMLFVWRVLSVIFCIGFSGLVAVFSSVVFEPVGSDYQLAFVSGSFIFMLLLTVSSVQVFSTLMLNVSKLANHVDDGKPKKKK